MAVRNLAARNHIHLGDWLKSQCEHCLEPNDGNVTVDCAELFYDIAKHKQIFEDDFNQTMDANDYASDDYDEDDLSGCSLCN